MKGYRHQGGVFVTFLVSQISPWISETKTGKKANKKITFPQFRKNIYTKEIIDFILEQIETKQKTIKQVIEEYKIPKTTLYKWISKYKINPNED